MRLCTASLALALTASACGGATRFAAPGTGVSVELPCTPKAEVTAAQQTTWRCRTDGLGAISLVVVEPGEDAWRKSTAADLLAAVEHAALEGLVLVDQVETKEAGRTSLVTLARSEGRAVLRRAVLDPPRIVVLVAEGGSLDEARALLSRAAPTLQLASRVEAADAPALKTPEELCADSGGAMQDGACVKDGKREGVAVVKGEDGRVREKGTYVRGEKHGLFVEWDEMGRKRAETRWEHGKQHGPASTWSATGVPLLVGEWAHGKEHGLFVQRDEDGVVRKETRYREGAKDGVEATYFENGKKESETTWVAGRRHGRAARFHPTGGKASEGAFHDDREHGPFTTWGPGGEPQLYRVYKAGAVVLEIREDPCPPGSDEKLRRLDQRVLERWCEKQITRVEKGTGWYARRVVEKGKHGPYRSWSVNGVLEVAGRYKEGDKDGRWTTFDAEGRPLRVEHWQGGALTAVEEEGGDEGQRASSSSTKKKGGSSPLDAFPSFTKTKSPTGTPSTKPPRSTSTP